jgi:hypothetical protein
VKLRARVSIKSSAIFYKNAKRESTVGGASFGIHRFSGLRLAEMQLRVLWPGNHETLPGHRGGGEPKRMLSSLPRGYEGLPVRIPA